VRSEWAASCDLIWNGVDADEFSPNGPVFGLGESLGLSAETLLIGQVARLESNKVQFNLLAGGRRLLRKRDCAMVRSRPILAGDANILAQWFGTAAADSREGPGSLPQSALGAFVSACLPPWSSDSVLRAFQSAGVGHLGTHSLRHSFRS
jgi:hypothetical protein